MNHIELLEELRHIDEVTLLELLEITSEELVDTFRDRILEKDEFIRKEIQP
jgi:hypothetical protein